MNFLNLSLLGVLAGLAGLAGILFALQQLRARHTEVTVPTTIFWAAAVRQAPVRILRRRFRHWLAYLLVLVIAALLWIGFAGPEVADERPSDAWVLYLDGSAHTSDPAAFEAARRQLVEDAAALPAAGREAILGGAHNITLLRPGEDAAILEGRLEGAAPEAAEAGIDALLRLMAGNGARPERVNVVIYGRAPVSEAALEALPPGFSVTRAAGDAANGVNRGIVALGVGDAASGAWDRVDVTLRVAVSEGSPPTVDELRFSLDGLPADGLEVAVVPGGFAIRDLPATGATLQATLAVTDAVPLDNTAWVTLPARRVLRVALGDGAPDAVRSVILAHLGLEPAADGAADVAVAAAGETAPGGLPLLKLVSMAEQESAFEIGYTGDGDGQRVLEEAMGGLGLDQIDAQGLASAMDRAVGVAAYPAEQRAVSIWSELLDARYNFVDSRAFPVFLSKALCWLAEEPAWYAYVAAGRPVRDRTGQSCLAGAPPPPDLDALGADYIPGRAQRDFGDEGLSVSLLSEAVSVLAPGAGLEIASGTASAAEAPVSPVTWLILAALVLLGLEWWLYQRNLMP